MDRVLRIGLRAGFWWSFLQKNLLKIFPYLFLCVSECLLRVYKCIICMPGIVKPENHENKSLNPLLSNENKLYAVVYLWLSHPKSGFERVAAAGLLKFLKVFTGSRELAVTHLESYSERGGTGVRTCILWLGWQVWCRLKTIRSKKRELIYKRKICKDLTQEKQELHFF